MKGKIKELFNNVDVTERIPNGYYIGKLFERYYLYKLTSNTLNDDVQSIPSSYNMGDTIVNGGYHDGQAKMRQIERKAEADMFIQSVDELMCFIAKEENFYYTMIDNYYRHDIKHKRNMYKLGYYPHEERRYFRDWDKAVSYFVREALNRDIKVN